MKIQFIVPGNPFGKKRPRFGGGRTYSPRENREYEALVREKFGWARYLQGLPILPFADRPVRAEITAYYPIPKDTSKALEQLMLSGANRPAKKPDCDNVEKAVYDALNGLAYKDDAQIVESSLKKYYAVTPCVKVEISDV